MFRKIEGDIVQLTGFGARTATRAQNEHAAAEQENKEHHDHVAVEAPNEEFLRNWLGRRGLWARRGTIDA